MLASDFGIGIAVDLEGNCRFYDLIRLKKLAKISANANVGHNLQGGQWRLLPQPVLCTTSDAFFGLTQTDQVEGIEVPEPPQPPPQDPKNPKPVETPEPYVLSSQKDIVVNGKNSNNVETLKSLEQIQQSAPENNLFVLQ